MTITLQEAVREVGFFVNNGGINISNHEHVSRIINIFGENTHEIFQEAADQIRTLVASGIVVESALVAAQS